MTAHIMANVGMVKEAKKPYSAGMEPMPPIKVRVTVRRIPKPMKGVLRKQAGGRKSNEECR